ncbi:MAG: hypothetical protein GC162_14210 [Planctomycetes bacterium]|nr:hypothetical protein [Planctomycetota bacterium]
MSDPHSHHDDPADSPVSPEERELFDTLLDELLAELPASLVDRLQEIPLIVEDFPDDDVLDDMGLEDGADLCGLHTGVPLTERGVETSGDLPDVIHLFRDAILNLAADADGVVDEEELRKQIRITLLHEMGHHFGLDEDDLDKLGYA